MAEAEPSGGGSAWIGNRQPEPEPGPEPGQPQEEQPYKGTKQQYKGNVTYMFTHVPPISSTFRAMVRLNARSSREQQQDGKKD